MKTLQNTMFGQVVFMNECFGNPTSSGRHEDIDWAKLEKQCGNILNPDGELKELKEALAARDPIKVRDALADIMVYALGGFQRMGVNAEADMTAVFYSNMSKFCSTQDEVEATVAKYQELGVEVYVEGEFPRKCVKSAKDQTCNKGDFHPKGKFLKGVRYEPPVFAEFNPIYPPNEA